MKNSLIKNNDLGTINSQAVIFNPVKPIFFNVKDNELKNRLNIIYIGQISKRKGLIDLVKSLSELKKKAIMYQLSVVGDYNEDKYKELILSAIKENNLESQIKFYGWQTQESIVELMENIGIFILPSNQESLPMSIIESMSSGKVVIATDVGGVSEIIKKEENGYLYKRNDIKQLSSILENLFFNQGKFLEISRNARIYAKKNFAPSEIANKTKEFYSEVINK